MLSTTTIRRWVAVLVAGGVIAVVTGSALADDALSIDELRTQLEAMEADTADDVAVDEFEQAYQWLDEAEQLQAEGRTRGAEFRVRRADHMVDWVRALAQLRDIEESIADREQAYEEARQQLERRRDEIETLEAQVEERKQELERIRADLE